MSEFTLLCKRNWSNFFANIRQGGIIYACKEDWKRIKTEGFTGAYKKTPQYRLDRLKQYHARQELKRAWKNLITPEPNFETSTIVTPELNFETSAAKTPLPLPLDPIGVSRLNKFDAKSALDDPRSPEEIKEERKAFFWLIGKFIEIGIILFITYHVVKFIFSAYLLFIGLAFVGIIPFFL